MTVLNHYLRHNLKVLWQMVRYIYSATTYTVCCQINHDIITWSILHSMIYPLTRNRLEYHNSKTNFHQLGQKDWYKQSYLTHTVPHRHDSWLGRFFSHGSWGCLVFIRSGRVTISWSVDNCRLRILRCPIWWSSRYLLLCLISSSVPICIPFSLLFLLLVIITILWQMLSFASYWVHYLTPSNPHVNPSTCGLR